jgi:hypothetical protein
MRSPKVVSLTQREVRRVVRTGLKRGPIVVQRWYVVLRFGGEDCKLAISEAAAKWLKRKVSR